MAKYYTKEELKKILCYNSKESYIAIPNSIFELLSKNEEIMKAKAPHVAIMYSYIYLNTWLYRYTKYGDLSDKIVSVKGIKKIIGLSENSKDYDYAFKKNGVLEQLGILKTESFTEAPILWSLDEDNYVFFEYFKDYYNKDSDMAKNVKRKQIKTPTFAFEERTVKGETYNGTFYDPEHTHTIPFEVFLECMSNKDLGYTAFYIYAYLHSRCQMNGGDIEVSVEKISSVTGVNRNSRTKALDSLKKYGLVSVVMPADYIVGRGDEETPANVYKTNVSEHSFSSKPMPYQKVK